MILDENPSWLRMLWMLISGDRPKPWERTAEGWEAHNQQFAAPSSVEKRLAELESAVFKELPPQLVAIEHELYELTGFESETKKLMKNAVVTYKIDDKVVSEEEWNEAAGPQPKAKLGLAKLRHDTEPPVQ